MEPGLCLRTVFLICKLQIFLACCGGRSTVRGSLSSRAAALARANSQTRIFFIHLHHVAEEGAFVMQVYMSIISIISHVSCFFKSCDTSNLQEQEVQLRLRNPSYSKGWTA